MGSWQVLTVTSPRVKASLPCHSKARGRILGSVFAPALPPCLPGMQWALPRKCGMNEMSRRGPVPQLGCAALLGGPQLCL